MRTLISLITIIASVYLLLALAVYVFQDRIVFRPALPAHSPGTLF